MSLCCNCRTREEARGKQCYHNPDCGLFEIFERNDGQEPRYLSKLVSQGSRCNDCS